MAMESIYIAIGSGLITFVGTFTTLKNKHTELEKRVNEINNEHKKTKELIFKNYFQLQNILTKLLKT